MVDAASEQARVEARLGAYRRPLLESASPEPEAFGDESAWQIQVGRFQLLLAPGEERWFVHDDLHSTWEDTGVRPGEGVFVEVNGRLGLQAAPHR